MSGLIGLQRSNLNNLIEQMFAQFQRLEQRVQELEKLRVPPAHYIFKPFGEEAPTIGNGAVIWTVPKDVDGLRLEIAEAAYSFFGTGETEITIENLTQGVMMLFANLIINTGGEHSDDAAPEVEIDHALNQVFWRDKISINIVNAPSNASGISVTIGFV